MSLPAKALVHDAGAETVRGNKLFGVSTRARQGQGMRGWGQRMRIVDSSRTASAHVNVTAVVRSETLPPRNVAEAKPSLTEKANAMLIDLLYSTIYDLPLSSKALYGACRSFPSQPAASKSSSASWPKPPCGPCTACSAWYV